MSSRERVIIVGGGLSAARAAEAIRGEGFDGDVAVYAAENRLPYERPPLSKGYLLGADGPESTIPLDAAWYQENNVSLSLATEVTSLDTEAHTIQTSAGADRYDRLLLATGARPRRFDGPGAGLTGVYHLRTLHDSTVLRTALRVGGRRVVVVGSGWIGLEVAAAAKTLGNKVTVIGHSSLPLESVLGPELGAVFGALHTENGVELRMEAAVTAIRGDRHVDGVVLGTGEEIDADIVVVGIGALPNTELAAAAGITVDDGIVTDAGLATGAVDVFAAGDVASAFHPVLGKHLRVEHWQNAQGQGAAAGRALAGAKVEYDAIPYFFTDQFDLGMEYSGYGELAIGADVLFRGDVTAREFVAFWVKEDRVVAGMNVNVWDVNDGVQELIRSARPIDRSALVDPEVALENVTVA